jgi:tetratricopeptide (TPR) repeat protein
MAMFYNNIGIIYYEEEKYLEALDFYKKSLAIHVKHLPPDHPDLGSSYNNIGIVHRCLGHSDLALEHYNRSLEISLKSLPAQHPTFAVTYTNIGLGYEDKSELNRYQHCFESVLSLFSDNQIAFSLMFRMAPE